MCWVWLRQSSQRPLSPAEGVTPPHTSRRGCFGTSLVTSLGSTLMGDKHKTLSTQRDRRRFRVRNQSRLNLSRPRLSVHRSLMHISAQIIDDVTGATLASAGSNEKSLRTDVGYGGNKDAAMKIGRIVAERAVAAGIIEVRFDRGAYKYHGRGRRPGRRRPRSGFGVLIDRPVPTTGKIGYDQRARRLCSSQSRRARLKITILRSGKTTFCDRIMNDFPHYGDATQHGR